MKGLQLPLGVQLPETASFETFYAGPNAEVVAALEGLPRDTAPPLLLVYGPAGAGKSHLLQALTRAAAARARCAYVPLAQFAALEPAEALAGLESADCVCLDDVDAVGARPGWPLALLRVLDGLRAHGGHGVLAAAAPPERLGVALPDLRTRLAGAARYGLKPLSDHDRTRFLLDRSRARGLELAPEAARYLLARLPRDTGSLVGALDSLDHASLSAQRRLTLAFVQQWVRDRDR